MRIFIFNRIAGPIRIIIQIVTSNHTFFKATQITFFSYKFKSFCKQIIIKKQIHSNDRHFFSSYKEMKNRLRNLTKPWHFFTTRIYIFTHITDRGTNKWKWVDKFVFEYLKIKSNYKLHYLTKRWQLKADVLYVLMKLFVIQVVTNCHSFVRLRHLNQFVNLWFSYKKGLMDGLMLQFE